MAEPQIGESCVRGCADQRIDPSTMPGAECLRLKRRKGEGRVDARGSGDVDLGVFPANARTRWRQARLGATKTLAVADADAKNFRDAPLPGRDHGHSRRPRRSGLLPHSDQLWVGFGSHGTVV